MKTNRKINRIYLPFLFLLSMILVTTSCSEEDSIIEENQVISDTNFEILKANALSEYNSNDYHRIVKPSVNTTNYEEIIQKLNNNQNPNLTFTKFEDYKVILGKYYDEEYFNQLLALYQYSETLIQSDLFNENSTIEEREPYLIEVLEFVILSDLQNNIAYKSSNCAEHRTVCQNQAESTLGNTIAGCTGLAVVAGLLTGGVGAASWPVCMGAAGLQYDTDMEACQQHYEVCMDQ